MPKPSTLSRTTATTASDHGTVTSDLARSDSRAKKNIFCRVSLVFRSAPVLLLHKMVQAGIQHSLDPGLQGCLSLSQPLGLTLTLTAATAAVLLQQSRSEQLHAWRKLIILAIKQRDGM